MRNSFEKAHQRFRKKFPSNAPNSETGKAVNWAIADCLRHYTKASTKATKCGVACYLVVRLRNSLMHVLDDSVSLYADKEVLLKVAGLAFAVLRLSKHGEEGLLAKL